MPLLIAVAALSVAMSLADESKLTITRIIETRVREVASSQKGQVIITGGPSSLRVSMDVPLPEGARLVKVEQPTKIEAKDNAGTDLTKIDKRFGDEVEYWFPLFNDDSDRGNIELQLKSASRKAESFDLSLTAVATIATGLTTIEFEQAKEYTKLDEALFGQGAEFRVRKQDYEVMIDFKPESLSERIKTVSLKSKTKFVANNGGNWGMGVATYIFSQGIEDDAKIVVSVLTGFKKLNVSVDAKDLKLP